MRERAHLNSENVKAVETALKNAGVVIMATDTVYGLVCLAASLEAVKRLYEVKGREGKPGTIIAASIEQFIELGFDSRDLEEAQKYWPGPVSIILPAPDKLAYLHMGLDSLAVRIPANKQLRELLQQTGPFATTSANRPGEPTVKTMMEAKAILSGKIALYIDGGKIDSPPSTILQLTDTGFKKIR